jgi:hypothetical protein
MGVSLVYLGHRGGGSQFAHAVYESLRSEQTKLIVSDQSSEVFPAEAIRVPGIPSGVISNVIFCLKLNRRKTLLQTIADIIEKDSIVFLMPHPIDFPLRRRLKKNSKYTVIHDAKRHKGDIWPLSLTIRRLAKAPGTKIFLSNHVYQATKKFIVGDASVLPLLMGKIVDDPYLNRDIDIAILGRHKKYKNVAFQLRLIDELGAQFSIFASVPPGTQKRLKPRAGLVIREGWLSTSEFQQILQRSKSIILTHSEASQSGLIVDAIRFGVCPVVPNIPGLEEQARKYELPWVYKPSDLIDAKRQLVNAINQRDLLLAPKKFLAGEVFIWRSFFRADL